MSGFCKAICTKGKAGPRSSHSCKKIIPATLELLCWISSQAPLPQLPEPKQVRGPHLAEGQGSSQAHQLPAFEAGERLAAWYIDQGKLPVSIGGSCCNSREADPKG